jgi:hypothetical protein
MTPGRFENFVAIDWSGAVGERHAGIAVALAQSGDEAPMLVLPRSAAIGHKWSRPEVREWLADELPPNSLVGLDLGISLPFVDRDAFFPGWVDSPPDARALWALIDRLCEGDAHLAVGGFVDHPDVAPHFRRHGGREGAWFGAGGKPGGRGRLRETERAQELLGCRPYSNFNLVGAAQVGKSSLSGMRMLHRLSGVLPVWPVDPLPTHGSVIVEIYTTMAALEAGRRAGRSKMRSHSELNAALSAFGSAPIQGSGPIDDHKSDALLTAAWLRRAAHRSALWTPAGLDAVGHIEGWTFGAP